MHEPLQPRVYLEQGAPEFGKPFRWVVEHADHGRQLVVAEPQPHLVRVDGFPDMLGKAEVASSVEEQRKLCDGGAGDLDPRDGHLRPICPPGRWRNMVALTAREKLLPQRLEFVDRLSLERGPDGFCRVGGEGDCRGSCRSRAPGSGRHAA